MANMASSLIEHKSINTTLAKAKELRKYVEPLLTKAKSDDTHNRRIIFSMLKNKEAVKELFGVVAPKIAQRPGGYTRIIKLGFRLGDAAEMCMIELVDFNEIYSAKKETKKAKTRRGGKKAATAAPAVEAAAPSESAPAAAPEAEDASSAEEAPKAQE